MFEAWAPGSPVCPPADSYRVNRPEAAFRKGSRLPGASGPICLHGASTEGGS